MKKAISVSKSYFFIIFYLFRLPFVILEPLDKHLKLIFKLPEDCYVEELLFDFNYFLDYLLSVSIYQACNILQNYYFSQSKGKFFILIFFF